VVQFKFDGEGYEGGAIFVCSSWPERRGFPHLCRPNRSVTKFNNLRIKHVDSGLISSCRLGFTSGVEQEVGGWLTVKYGQIVGLVHASSEFVANITRCYLSNLMIVTQALYFTVDGIHKQTKKSLQILASIKGSYSHLLLHGRLIE